MIAAVDVQYEDCPIIGGRGATAVAACVLFDTWTADTPADTRVVKLDHVEPYVPGQFYKRELPCLLAVLSPVLDQVDTVIVDGYVWLGENKPGLGAYLYEALGEKKVVVGVAKTRFADAPAEEVLRGQATHPLYVTAAGLDAIDAAAKVRSMHGEYRIPSILKLVDQLCRSKTPTG